MTSRARFAILLALLIFIDAVLLQVLTTDTEAVILIDRLLSLSAGLVAALALHRVLPAASDHVRQPGFWALVTIGLVLNYGIFVALASRAPQVQPLVHFGFAWACALIFGGFGLYRIRRWRN
jgi:zinc transporter ZupT